MTKETFDKQLALSLQSLEHLWQQAEEFPTQSGGYGYTPSLNQGLEELSNSLQELQVAAEEIRQQNEELAEHRISLEAERQRYQELFDHAPIGYLLTDNDAIILEANRTVGQLLNVSSKRLVSKPLVIFIDAEERREFYLKLRQLQKGELIKNWQIQIQRWRGEQLPVSITATPIRDYQRKLIGLRWQFCEIAATKKNEPTTQQNVSNQAKEEQRLFSAMFENAANGVAILDNQGNVIKSNRALQEMLGYGPEKLPKVFSDLVNLDKEGLESAMFQQLIAGKRRSYQRELRFFPPDKSVQWGRLTFALVRGIEVKENFATCTLENITELHQLKAAQEEAIKHEQAIKQQLAVKKLEASISEQKLASNQLVEKEPQQIGPLIEHLGKILNDILSSTPEFFFVYDKSGKYIYVNRSAAQALGLAQSDFISKTWQQLELPAEVMERLDAQRAIVFSMGQPITDEASFSTVEGMRDYEYTISPITDIDNHPEAVVVTVRDITEQKRAAAAASEALAKEEEFSALKSHFSYFASLVSQELRNPLNNIFACTKLIESKTQQHNDEKTVNYLKLIQVNVRRINYLLNDLLLIKKVEAKELKLSPVLLDLTEFCREFTEDLQQTPGQQHLITFTSQGEGSGVRIDHRLLRHVLTNLMVNAIKYSPVGSEVKLDLVYQENQVSFRIQDFGIGIPQADQELLFKTFHRGSNVGAVSGCGLGLLIVKQCLDLLGGEISLESEVGVGTTVTVTLPMNS